MIDGGLNRPNAKHTQQLKYVPDKMYYGGLPHVNKPCLEYMGTMWGLEYDI